MRHADALSRCVHLVAGDYALTRDRIREAQSKDPSCEVYKTCEQFWLDDGQLLYYENQKGCPLVVIPKVLVEIVLRGYHELLFTAHQGIMRTIAAIRQKYWWESLDRDVREYINACEACAKRKIGNRVTALLGDSLEAQEFLDVVSLDVVGPLPVTENGNKYCLHL
jgi:cytochrome c1